MKRDMIATAEKAEAIKDDRFCMTVGEMKQLLDMIKDGDMNDALNAIVIAYNYGYVHGHRAALSKKNKEHS